MKSTWTVIRREYLQAVRRPAFWIGVLLIPVFIVIANILMSVSAKSAESKISEQTKQAKTILVVDEGHFIADEVYKQSDKLRKASNAQAAESSIKNHKADVAIVYPANLTKGGEIRIYWDKKDASPANEESYNQLAQDLLKTGVLADLPPGSNANLLASQPPIKNITYQNGTIYKFSEDVPYLALMAILLVVVFSSSNMFLLSVTEEKENRAIEIIMTAVKSQNLIRGKIIGLCLVALTQVTVLSGLSLAVMLLMKNKLPFTLSLSGLDLLSWHFALGLFYLLAGVLLIAAIMVAIGASVPSAKDASGLMTVAMLSVLAPVYFITAILQDPAGIIAKVTSYFPLTAPVILQTRNMFEALPGYEIALSIALMLAYIALATWLATRIFRLAAFNFNSRLAFSELFSRKRQ
jgi:ABC-2 type transport system permease protein